MIMKTKASCKIIAYLLGLVVPLFLITGCGKTNVAIRENDDNGIPNQDIPYISYYVVNNKTVTNIHYLTASNIDQFHLSKGNDTASFYMQFSNGAVTSDNSHTNEWIFCDSSYDKEGVDQFDFFCQWQTDSAVKLTVGRTYNLNEIRDSKSVPLEETNGFVTYRHTHRDLALITSLSTIAAITDPQPQNSYLIINNIENNTASGTFTLAFSCKPDNYANLRYVNYVKGMFHKVPISQ